MNELITVHADTKMSQEQVVNATAKQWAPVPDIRQFSHRDLVYSWWIGLVLPAVAVICCFSGREKTLSYRSLWRCCDKDLPTAELLFLFLRKFDFQHCCYGCKGDYGNICLMLFSVAKIWDLPGQVFHIKQVSTHIQTALLQSWRKWRWTMQ